MTHFARAPIIAGCTNYCTSKTDYIQPSSIDILSSGTGTTGKQSVLWQGTQGDLRLTSLTEFDANNLYFVTSVTVQNIGQQTITDFYYVRTVDPDQGQWHPENGYQYTTRNWISAQPYQDGDPAGRSDPNVPSKCLISCYAANGDTHLNHMFGGLAAINDNCRVGINPYGQLANDDPTLPWTSTRWEVRLDEERRKKAGAKRQQRTTNRLSFRSPFSSSLRSSRIPSSLDS